MRILAFPGRMATKVRAPVQDWSTQEIADFYRAHRLLAENGAGIGIDRGLSDEGEPWMVFFDVVSQDVFLHIARIDGTCKLVCEPFNMRLDAADIASLIAQFEHAVTDYLAIRSDRAKNIVIHPAARIIMSISAVFLLFKLENGEAYAKGLVDKAVAPAPDRVTEKSATALARAQAAFQRAFDAFEPAHAAMIAGLILASELVVSSLGETGENPAALSTRAEVVHQVHVAVFPGNVEDATVDVPHAPVPVPVADVQPALAVTLLSIDVEPSPQIAFTPADSVVHMPQLGPALDFRLVEATATIAAVTVVPGGDVVKPKSDAETAFEYLLSVAVDKVKPSAPAVEAPPAVASDKLGDVSLENLASLEGKLAFSASIDLSVVDLIDLINFVDQNMAGYEFGFDSGRFLIEEADIADLEKHDVATLVTHLGDGSAYMIIGRADIISEAMALFS